MRKTYIFLGIRVTAAHQHNEECYQALVRYRLPYHKAIVRRILGIPVFIEYVRTRI